MLLFSGDFVDCYLYTCLEVLHHAFVLACPLSVHLSYLHIIYFFAYDVGLL